jgi:hypothetical protein
MDITKMSESELKAVGYDMLRDAERIQNNLRMIDMELSRRAQVKQDANNK